MFSFPTLDLWEASFSAVTAVKTRLRSRLDIRTSSVTFSSHLLIGTSSCRETTSLIQLILHYDELILVRYSVILFTNPSARAGYDTRSIFKRSLTGLNSEFSFSLTSCLTKAEEPSLCYYLPIAGGRIAGFIPFPRVLVLCEMQSASSRIWTRAAVSISYDDNH